MEVIKDISIIFISIIFESLPFLLLGALISSIIERFVSNDTITRIMPKNVILGSLMGILIGFFLPACDCAVIPVSKRLIKKKVPLNVSISFMLSSPIINPVVLLSTYYAFGQTNIKLFWLRILFGIIIALVIGIIIGIIFKNKTIVTKDDSETCCHHHIKSIKQKKELDDFFDLVEEESDDDIDDMSKIFKNNIVFIIKHTIIDTMDVFKYLIFGSLLASVIQVLLPQNFINLFSNSNVLSIILLMVFAYLISLCSTADSFIGKSLMSHFSDVSILAYLLLGPMIDIKNTVVLLGNFNKKFVLTLISLIFIVVFMFCLFVEKLI